jgi:AraC-like DNA-binding protein
MDVLSSILDSIKLKAVVYRRTSFTAQWGVEVPQDSNSQFWRLLKGTCYIILPGQDAIKMKAGDFIFVPHGSGHLICSRPGIRCVPSAQYVQSLNSQKPMFKGDEEETVLIGGHFEFASSQQHPFLKSLPKVIQIDNTNIELSLWLQSVASFMNEEVCGEKPGNKLILGRLAEVLFILIIRSYMERADVEEGFLMALKDERISSSLKAMHESPEKEWTLNQLATAAGMSRSLYCKEFKRLAGETPLSYLTNWRMLKAREFLLHSKKNVIEVAGDVGYQSEAAFNRIFKSKVGETPASYRRKLGTK